MRAIVLNDFGGVESLIIKELPDPEPKAGHVLIAVKAFGVNQAETHKRKGDWAEAAEVSGIECVGEVVLAPGRISARRQSSRIHGRHGQNDQW